MISIMQPVQSVQLPIMTYKEFLCSLLTALPNQQPMLHREWRFKNLRIQINKSYFFNVLHPFSTETYVFLLGKRKSIAIMPIYLLSWQQFNIRIDFFQLKMMKALTMPPQMTKMNIHVFRTLQRPPSSQKFFLERFLTVWEHNAFAVVGTSRYPQRQKRCVLTKTEVEVQGSNPGCCPCGTEVRSPWVKRTYVNYKHRVKRTRQADSPS
jgi:hypothetical protein